MTTLISSHVDQALGRIINQSAMPIIGQLMEEIAKNAAGGVEMGLTQITENLREELEQRLKVGAEGKATLSLAMADWYTTRVKRIVRDACQQQAHQRASRSRGAEAAGLTRL